MNIDLMVSMLYYLNQRAHQFDEYAKRWSANDCNNSAKLAATTASKARRDMVSLMMDIGCKYDLPVVDDDDIDWERIEWLDNANAMAEEAFAEFANERFAAKASRATRRNNMRRDKAKYFVYHNGRERSWEWRGYDANDGTNQSMSVMRHQLVESYDDDDAIDVEYIEPAVEQAEWLEKTAYDAACAIKAYEARIAELRKESDDAVKEANLLREAAAYHG